jgi:hypothetical protein
MRSVIRLSGITLPVPNAERSVASALSGIALCVPRFVTSSTTSRSGQRLRTAAIALSRHRAPGTQLSFDRRDTNVLFDAHEAGGGLSFSMPSWRGMSTFVQSPSASFWGCKITDFCAIFLIYLF